MLTAAEAMYADMHDGDEAATVEEHLHSTSSLSRSSTTCCVQSYHL